MKKELVQEIKKMNGLIDTLCESDMGLFLKRRGIVPILDDMIDNNLEYVDENTQPYDFVHFVIQDTIQAIELDHIINDTEEIEQAIIDNYFNYILNKLFDEHPELRANIDDSFVD